MIEAYILIQAANGASHRVAASMAELPEVLTAHPIMGPYDVIACVRVDDADGMGRWISERVHVMSGVLRTLTCSVVPASNER